MYVGNGQYVRAFLIYTFTINKCIFFHMKINAFQFNELSLKTINFRFSPWFLVPVGLAL